MTPLEPPTDTGTLAASSGENPHIVIVGGGFAGLAAARGLQRAAVRITLIDRRNFHLFQPLLYQVATGGLSPAEISAPLRSILSRQKNVTVLKGEVTGFDLASHQISFDDQTLGFDYLIVATGAKHHYFGHPEWEDYAPGLKTIEDATRIRANLLAAFERAEVASDANERDSLLTFVIVGAGPTGVELAGALAELAHWTLRREFRNIDPRSARILLIDGADRVLPTFAKRASVNATASLERLGVEVCTGQRVTSIDSDGVSIRDSASESRISSQTVLWASGVAASPLAQTLASECGIALERGGTVPSRSDLTLEGYPNVFVLGDMACVVDRDGKPLPGIAPVAMQQGQYVARSLSARLTGRSSKPFKYRDKGQLAVIGRASAAAEVRGVHLSGYPAWILWLFVHILYLADFGNRLLVLFEWGYSYLTRRRGARLITRSTSLSSPPPPQPRVHDEPT